ncbi:hypothetical protein M088_5978 [Bacteroides ovatus str. 3725 D1 iv]|nr:hypothetical protein M088_5978 [Bacteroides ovatus str. 3725 D1 iv]
MSDPDDVCTAMDDIEFMKYCYEHFDVNKDGKVSPVEAQAVTTIGFGNSTTSISGISVSYTHLSNCLQIEKVYCYDCSLSSITMKRSQDRYKIFGYVSVGNVYYID